MSTEVKLVAIQYAPEPNGKPGCVVPRLVAELTHLGCSRLKHLLGMHTASKVVVWDGDESEPGLYRYYIPDPLALAADIDVSSPYAWEGLNAPEYVVEALRAHPEYTWWFHVEF